jgi:hypothetical protein
MQSRRLQPGSSIMRIRLLAALAALAFAGAGAGAARAAAAGPTLAFPLACKIGRDCEVQNYVDRDPTPAWLDYHCGRRSYNGHTGTDIRVLDLKMQRAGVDVLAAAPGRVLRLRDGVPDVLIRNMSDPHDEAIGCGNAVVLDHGGGWITAYCHMARGSVRVKVGDPVKAGDPIARVGLSGQTEFPHLHLTVRQAGKVVDPFAPDAAAAGRCAAGAGLAASMWTPAAQRALVYKPGAILNAGFAGAAVSMPAVEAGGIAPPNAASPAVVAYMRAIELEQGDVLELTLKGPDGATLATQRLAPLDHDKAQYFALIGRKRPAAGWPKGRYAAVLRVIRAGKPVLARQIAVSL